MPPRGWRKLPKSRETEFILAYQNLRNTVAMLAMRFDISRSSVYNLARRLNLPRRMRALEALQLPPFGKRGPRKAA